MNFFSANCVGLEMFKCLKCPLCSICSHPPATLDSSRSSNSASWCNASADSWGAPGKHSRMMLMLSKLPCGEKWHQQRWVIMADLTNVNTSNSISCWVNSFGEQIIFAWRYMHTDALEQQNVNGVGRKLWHFEVIQAEALLHNTVTWWT